MPRKSYIRMPEITKYSLAQLKYLLKTNKFTKSQKASILKKLPKTQLEKQWWDIRARYKYRITRAEFEEYYYLSRKVKRKIRRLVRQNKIYGNPEVLTGIGAIISKGVKYFRNQLRQLRNRYRRSWRREHMSDLKERIIDSLYQVFGYGNIEVMELANRIENLSHLELLMFLSEHPELRVLDWHHNSPHKIRDYFDKLDMTLTKIGMYFDAFEKEHDLV